MDFLLLLLLSLSTLPFSHSSDMQSMFTTDSSPNLVQFSADSREIFLELDQKNASGFQSIDGYIFGWFDMQIKLVPGDSAGTVTTYYFSSLGPKHDELDFEFLGNSSGQPYVLQTNVYASGVGGREQRINLWFDPTADFHNYSLLWNEQQIVFSVDSTPIRIFPNVEAVTGVPYLHNQTMKCYATIWDGDSWATQGGMIKINWTHAPFVASYRDFTADSCADTATMSATDCASAKWWNQAAFQALDVNQANALKRVEQIYMGYNYCTDTARYNVTPPECFYSTPDGVSTAISPSPSPSAGPNSSPSVGSLPVVSSPSPSPSQFKQSGAPKPLLDLVFPTIFLILSLCVQANLM